MSSTAAERTQELVARAKEGDSFAWEQLCGVYGERIRRVIRLRMGGELRSQLDSMDLVQEAMIAAVQGLDRFQCRKEGDFLRWMASVAENKIRDQVDRMHAGKRDVRRQVPLEADKPQADAAGIQDQILAATTPSMLLSQSEDLDRLERAMDRLKPEYRQVLLLAKIEGFSHSEVGARLDRTPAAVAKLLARALVALANEFEAL